MIFWQLFCNLDKFSDIFLINFFYFFWHFFKAKRVLESTCMVSIVTLTYASSIFCLNFWPLSPLPHTSLMDRPLDHWQQCADACDEGALGDHRRGHIALACCFQAGMVLSEKNQHCTILVPDKTTIKPFIKQHNFHFSPKIALYGSQFISTWFTFLAIFSSD